MTVNASPRPARPLQPHGTTARAYGRRRSNIPPCDCEPCIAARRRYGTRRHKLAALGRPGYVPATRAVRHVQALIYAGVTWVEIVAGTGVSHGTLARLRRNDATDTTIQAATEAKILAFPLPAAKRPGEARMNGVGVRRRLQALAREGWTCADIAGQSTLSEENLRRLMRASRVTVATHDCVVALYARLENTPGPSVEAGRRAERKGWPRPVDWYGLNIDDPETAPVIEAERRTRPLVVAEEAEFLASQGFSREEIAARLGLTVNSLQIYLTRARALACTDSPELEEAA